MGIERAIFRSFLPGWVRLGWKPAKMFQEAKRLKIPSYKTQVMYDDIRLQRDRFNYTDKVVDFTATKTPTKRIMIETELRRRRKYRITGHFRVRDVETGYFKDEIRNFYSDTLRTKEGWSDEFMTRYSIPEIARYKIYESGEIVTIEHNKGWAY